MLLDILDSKTDSEVFGFFLSAPERSFSVLEVAKRTGATFLKVAHVLSKLLNMGLLKTFSKRGKKYYMINPRDRLVPGIKNYWVRQGPKYSDELFLAIKKLGNIKAAFLSGIFTGYPNLPVDILLVGKVNLKKLSDFLKAAEKMMGQEINYSVMTVEEFELRRNTFDKFIKDIFDYRHLVVVDELKKKKR